MVFVYVLMACLCAGVIGALVIMYLELKKMKLDRGKLSEDFKEFEKALKQSEKYQDKKGWISVEWIDRDDYTHTGVR